jgi:hypothetical protein
MSQYTSEVDADEIDFPIGYGYYDPRPFGSSGAAGSLPEQADQSAAAQEDDGTLLKWYGTRLWQLDTGTAGNGSGRSNDGSEPASPLLASQSSDTSEGSGAGSKRGHGNNTGNIMMWYVTERTRFGTAMSAVW